MHPLSILGSIIYVPSAKQLTTGRRVSPRKAKTYLEGGNRVEEGEEVMFDNLSWFQS